MRFPLLTKFFIAFLTTTAILVGLMIGLIQFFAVENFSDYVDQMELKQLDPLVEQLVEEYEMHESWDFLRQNHKEWRRIFILAGVIKLPQQRLAPKSRSQQPGRPLNFPPARMERPAQRKVLDVGARLSLFDLDKDHVMGKNPNVEEHTLRKIHSENQMVGYLGLQKMKGLSNPLDLYYLNQQKKLFYMVGFVFLIASVLVSFLLAKLLLNPIQELSTATKALAKRQFDTRLDVRTTDEIGQLTRDFNAMVERLREYDRRQNQWLSDISHELRTPLSILIGEIDAIQDGIREPDPQTIQSLQAEILHLSRLIEDLHMLSVEEARGFEISKKPVNLAVILGQALERFEKRFKTKGIELEWHSPVETAVINGDQDRLLQLFSNILNNSLKYTDAPGRVSIRTELKKDKIQISIDDTMPDVSEAMLPRLFDRLFRLEPSRNRKSGGSGLGLAICKTIIRAHEGQITALNSRLGGLNIKIEIPLAQSQ